MRNNSPFVLDVNLEAAHNASLNTLGGFINEQLDHLDEPYRVDESSLMVEWEGGVSDNSNVIPTLDSVWIGRARAVVHGGADL
ncbi:hypothetical protein OEA41_010678 [Lepraria neglecta]|uniref:Uncharacterized protein n=1 Tax=Lepraria neglecta TaxID=209136 RepID=A0AAD9YX32_9LECA|nr:hypothetical protein OEA41_010678 [Lepraria neglecta]